jgi:acyl carrier protein
MTTSIAELKELMISNGLRKDLVQDIDPAEPMAQQGFDSLDWPAIIVAVEGRYGVKISDTDALRLKTLNDFEKYINTAG